jgi:hypothetical protein
MTTLTAPDTPAKTPRPIPEWSTRLHRFFQILATAGGCRFFEPLPEKKRR